MRPSLRNLLRRRRQERVAFVLSGGGNLGALQVGMLRALAERGVVPDLVVGCSVGAINGAAFARDPSPAGVERLVQLWRQLDGSELMPNGWLPNTVGFARRGEAIHDNAALRRSLEDELGDLTFEDLAVPFQCVATDVDNIEETWFSSGPLVDPILASAALPAVYPAVEIDGVRYLDGAIVDDVPMSRAVELGATTVYVLQVGGFSRPRPEPRRPLDVAVQAYWIARHYRYKRELASMPDHVTLHVLPTGEAPVMRYNDFTRTAELISVAHAATTAYLDELSPAPTGAAVDEATPEVGAVDPTNGPHARVAAAAAGVAGSLDAAVDAAAEAAIDASRRRWMRTPLALAPLGRSRRNGGNDE